MTRFEDLELKDFQALRVIPLRKRFNRDDLDTLTRLADLALQKNFKRHGRLHWKVYLHNEGLIQVRTCKISSSVLGMKVHWRVEQVI